MVCVLMAGAAIGYLFGQSTQVQDFLGITSPFGAAILFMGFIIAFRWPWLGMVLYLDIGALKTAPGFAATESVWPTAFLLAAVFIKLARETHAFSRIAIPRHIVIPLLFFCPLIVFSVVFISGNPGAYSKVARFVLFAWGLVAIGMMLSRSPTSTYRFCTAAAIVGTGIGIAALLLTVLDPARVQQTTFGTLLLFDDQLIQNYLPVARAIALGIIAITVIGIDALEMGKVKLVLTRLLPVLLVACGALFFTLSRSTLGATLGTVLVVVMARLRSVWGRFVGVTIALLLGGLIVVVAYNLGGGTFGVDRYLGSLSDDPSLYRRLYSWEKAIDYFLQNPFLGSGVGLRYAMWWDTEAANMDVGGYQFPHNLPLELLGETGLIGLILFGLPIVVTLRRYWANRLRLSMNPRWRIQATTIFGMLVFELIWSLMDGEIGLSRNIWLFTALLAGIVLQSVPRFVGSEGTHCCPN